MSYIVRRTPFCHTCLYIQYRKRKFFPWKKWQQDLSCPSLKTGWHANVTMLSGPLSNPISWTQQQKKMHKTLTFFNQKYWTQLFYLKNCLTSILFHTNTWFFIGFKQGIYIKLLAYLLYNEMQCITYMYKVWGSFTLHTGENNLLSRF